MDKGKKESLRTQIVWTAAVIAFLVGIGLTIAGFVVPPTGAIDGTVLTALGELLTFFGACFSIGEYTKIQLAKLKRAGNGEDNEE